MADDKKVPDANRDPLTGAPGAHPVGVGGGAVGGGVAGAAAGAALGGPVGAVVGAAVGAVGVGSPARGLAEAVNPTVEDAYWRDNYKTRPYISGEGLRRLPAGLSAWLGITRALRGKDFDAVEPDLRRDWEKTPMRRISHGRRPRRPPAMPGIGSSRPFPATRMETGSSTRWKACFPRLLGEQVTHPALSPAR